MELITANNDSIEGNEAIRQININMVRKEIAAFEKPHAFAWGWEDVEEYEDMIEELKDLLDELT